MQQLHQPTVSFVCRCTTCPAISQEISRCGRPPLPRALQLCGSLVTVKPPSVPVTDQMFIDARHSGCQKPGIHEGQSETQPAFIIASWRQAHLLGCLCIMLTALLANHCCIVCCAHYNRDALLNPVVVQHPGSAVGFPSHRLRGQQCPHQWPL